jgi:hypothetical protein
MFDRSLFKALMLIGIALPIASCTSSPSLTSIVVTPATMNFGGAGLTTQLTATGYYTHPDHPAKTENITNQVSWASATPACVTVNSTGLITSGGNICSNIPVTASAPGFNGLISGSMIVNVTQPNGSGGDIVSILVIPATQSVASLGVSVQYEAVGTTAGGATVALANYPLQLKWVSSNVSVATIGAATGLATTVGGGTTTITATFTNTDGSGAVGSAILTVAPSGSPEPLTSLTVSPNTQTASAAGQTAQFLAIATTGTGTSVNLTNQGAIVNGSAIKAAVWTSSNPSVASINSATGVASSLSVGATVITAIATNPDGSVVTGTSTYTVGGTGTTTAEPLASLAIVPATQTALAANQTAHFIAIGTTGSGATVNLTNQPAIINGATIKAAVWSSSNPSVATIDPATGIATSLSAGATAIVAIATNPDGTIVTGTAVYTVTVSSTTEPLASLAVVPASQTALAVNQTAHFIAIGTTGSGATVNLTNQPATVNGATIKAAVWSSSSPAVATVDPATGIATAVSAGATAITAIVTNPDGTVVSASAVYTVTVSASAEPVVSLAILPASQTSLTTGASANVNFIAIGTTGSGATVNLTNQPATINGVSVPAAVWGSSNPVVASINAATGVATPKSAGATAITAIVTNPDGTVVSASAPYTVTVPAVTEPYVSLAIVPASQTVTTSGQQARYLALGITGTGATVDLTNAPGVLWTTSSSAVATIVSNGVAQAVGNGVTAITAEVPNPGINGNPADGTVVSASASLTVNLGSTQEPLLSLSIQPSAQSVAGAPQTTQFLAIGDFSASSSTPGEQNMANIATYTTTWYSSNSQVASINSATGVATAVGPGTTAITAIATNNTDKSGATAVATFTVTGPVVLPIAALSIFPGSPSLTLPVIGSTTPATVQFYAIGTNGSTGLQTELAFPQVQWSSTNPLVAQIGSTGIATAVGPGSTTITAMATNTNGAVVTATATLTVAGSAAEPLLSLAIVPSAESVAYPAQAGQPPQTGQFTAVGTFTPSPTQPVTLNLTSNNTTFPIRWTSSNKLVATVGSPEQAGTVPGLVTAVGQGTAVIMAAATNPDASVVTATATFTVVNAPSEPVSALQIVPSTQSVSKGQNAQFIVLGLNAATGLQSDLTTAASLSWSSSIPTVATVCNAGPAQPTLCPTTPGQVTGVTAGSTTITAEYQNADKSVVTASATLAVTNVVAISNDIISVVIQPASETDLYIDQTTQFIAIGTSAAAPYTFDVTNCDGTAGPPCFGGSNVWASSNVDVATIETTGTTGPTSGGLGAPAGLATLLWEGTTAITATFTNSDNSIATGAATLECPFGECTLTGPPMLPLATLTVFGAGDDTTNWLVTAPSASGAANEIHCGPSDTTAGGQVCVGSYPIGTQITLSTTVPAASPACPTCTFGGWASGPATILVNTGTISVPVYTPEPSPSYCTPTPLVPTQTGLNQCTITVSGDDTVVAIFNK